MNKEPYTQKDRQNQPMLLFPLHIKILYEDIDVQYYPIGC